MPKACALGAAAAVLAALIATLAPQCDPFVLFLAAVSFGTFLAGTAAGVSTLALSIFFLVGWTLHTGRFGPPQHRAILAGTYLVVSGAQILLLRRCAAALAEAHVANIKAAMELDRQKLRFQELQHRVGNHMQVIASILTLQKKRVKSDPGSALAAIDETRERVVNMSRVHRRLYDPASAGRSVQQHLEDLCADFAASTPHRIVCSVASDAAIDDPLKLVTLSLLIGEAINNSLKHAFAEGETGMISVALTRNGNSHVLEISDTGCGVAAGFDSAVGAGLGLKIIQSLVGQLGGRLETISREGFTIRVVLGG